MVALLMREGIWAYLNDIVYILKIIKIQFFRAHANDRRLYSFVSRLIGPLEAGKVGARKGD